MSTVRSSCWASATARLKAMVVLPTPPFGAKTEMVRVAATSPRAANSFLTPAMRFIRSNPENGMASTALTPASGSTSTGFCGTVSMMTGTFRPDSLICSASLGPLIRPCSSASTSTTSGRSCEIWASALLPSLTTSSSFTV